MTTAEKVVERWKKYVEEFIEHDCIESNPYNLDEYCDIYFGTEVPYKCNGCPVFDAQLKDSIKCSDIVAIGEQSFSGCLAVLMFYQQFVGK